MRVFRHYIPKPLIALGIAEATVLFFALDIGMSIRYMNPSMTAKMLGDSPLPRELVFMVVMMGSMVATGLYQRGLRDDPKDVASRLLVSFGLGMVIMTLVFYAVPAMYLGRGAYLLGTLVGLAGVVVSRLVFYALTGTEALQRRVMVLGAGEEARQVTRLRRRSDLRGIKLIGFVHIRGEHDVVEPSRILQIDSDLVDLVEAHRVEELVIAVDDRRKAFPVEEIIECKLRGIRVIDVLTFYERQLGRINLEVLDPMDIIFLDGFSQAVLRGYSKRVVDVTVSLLLLVVAAPIMLITALAIKAGGGAGPIFYLQERVGRNGRVFEVYKFRSMRADAEKGGVAQWAGTNDPRVTPVGSFIRSTRIDELPQLFNVLKGDMSFVGPRPERPQFVEELTERIPYYAMRHRVNPGITGWAQISYPYGASVEDARHKLEYDLYYIKNYSIFLDFTIVFQTVQVVLWGQGAR